MKKFTYNLTFILIITLITSFDCYAQYDQSGGAWGSTKNYLSLIQNNTVPSADDTYDLGSSTKKWRDLYVDGNAYIDQLGINTSNPRRALDVLDPNNAQIRGTHTDNTNYFEIQADPNGDAIFTASGGEVSFSDENLSTTGTLGIGETSPETSQEITSTTPYITLHNSTDEKTDGGMESRIRFKGEDPNGVEYHIATIQASHDGTTADGKGDLIFQTNDGNDADDSLQERMRIDSSGNVGIGTTEPENIFQIGDYSETIVMQTFATNRFGTVLFKDNSSGYTARVEYDNGSNKNELNIQTSNAGDGRIIFSPKTTEAVRIDGTGNVGIGTTSPSSKLDIEQTGTAKATTDMLEITNTGNAADMDGTEAAHLFNLKYYDPNSPDIVDSGRIAVGAEQDMTSTASTQDTYMDFSTSLDGTLGKKMRISSSGYTNIAGNLARKFTITTDNTDDNATHTAAEMAGGLIRRGTGDEITGARTDVTDTAANIVAGIPNCIVGSGYEFSIANEDSTHTVALGGGTGVTIVPNDPSTAIPANSTGRFLLVVTNATASSETVDVHCLGYSTH